ncbi:MAG: HlyC/CorC family transporter [Planctomycetes bacterium]|nr:HlyC/CorC family transporter [Planctomycetota bacterium]
MDPATAAFWIGVAVVIITFCWIAYVSVVSDALHGYALSLLFEEIPENDEDTQRRFEELCRRDDEFIQVAETGRIIGFVLHFTGWIAIIMPEGIEFQLTHLLIGGLLSIISLVVCVVIVPPLILRHREEAALLVLLPAFSWIALLFKPFTVISSSVRRMGARIEGVDVSETAQESFEEDLADSLEEAEREGVLDEEEREMIQRVVELGQTPASRAMIPRTDMVCVDVEAGIDGALKLAVEHGHSRVPVYEGDRDHIIGVFYTRDLVPSWNQPPEAKPLELRQIIRPARFWPAGKVLDDLLREMREDRLKIAILTDEHGGTAGMITLEDILEEIVGDIRDEYDEGEVERAHRAILPFHRNQAEADGDVDLDEVNRVLEIDLPEAPEYNSVGGLMMHHLGRLAAKGDEVEIGELRLAVIDADEKRIKRVRITRTSDITETEVKR